MAVSDAEIAGAVLAYLEYYPDEAELLAEPVRQLAQGPGDFAWRRTFPMHVTVGALLVRPGPDILLIDHRAYGIWLQPGGHTEPSDASLVQAAVRELTEESGADPVVIDLASPSPVYIEYGPVPARPQKDEPAHFHLDIGYAFTTTHADVVGLIQESEVRGAAWYPLAEAERLVGHRITRALAPPARIG